MAGLQDNTLRIVLVGRSGNGKSATANSILGQRVFASKVAAESVTKSCQKEERDWKGRKLLVVDTPGLFDTKEKMSTTCEEIAKCVLYSCPGPHAIILVVQLGRHTEEERKTLELIKVIFGEPAMKHMIFLFTRKDQLDGEELSSFIAKSDKCLKAVIKECDLRCCAFNNRSADEAEKEAQLQQLVELIEAMVQENGGAHFSDPIYKHTEETWKRVEASVNKISDERAAMREKVKKKYDQKQISKEEMEKEMASIDEKYEKKKKSAREEGEENIRRDCIFQRWLQQYPLSQLCFWYSELLLLLTGTLSRSLKFYGLCDCFAPHFAPLTPALCPRRLTYVGRIVTDLRDRATRGVLFKDET